VSAALVQEGGFSPAQSRVCVDSQRALPGLVSASYSPRACVDPRVFTQNGNTDDEGTGLAFGYVANGLRAEAISETDVRAAVNFLANEGRLYSAIDDNHYKPKA
jgi:hypothetical protein